MNEKDNFFNSLSLKRLSEKRRKKCKNKNRIFRRVGRRRLHDRHFELRKSKIVSTDSRKLDSHLLAVAPIHPNHFGRNIFLSHWLGVFLHTGLFRLNF